MKAITCPQCGAVIKEISLKDKFVPCDYCGAKILLEEHQDRISDIPEKEEKQTTPWEQYRENYRKVEERAKSLDYLDNYENEEESLPARNYPIFGVIFILIIAGGLTLFFAFNLRKSNDPPKDRKEKPSPTLNLISDRIEVRDEPATPQINYDVKVQWSGNYDMEDFPKPEIDMSKLTTSDPAQLKKTVFKNRAVQVKITIGTSGEVTSATLISGHPILAEAALESAKKSLFNSRSKPTSRVLTYYFRLLDE